MSAAHWHNLQRAAQGLAFADLRYEQGPWLAIMEWLEDMDLVTRIGGNRGYEVSWRATEAGAALARANSIADNIPRYSESGRETGAPSS